MRPLAAAALVVLAAAPAQAQSEAQLKAFFEGKRVTVRIDMPAVEAGIDVRPTGDPRLDFTQYGNRIKGFGVAVPEGTSILVTKVKVKKDLIEFQLGGGGANAPSDSHHTYVGKSNREEDLEKERKNADQNRKRAIDRELDDLRRQREREEQAAHALDAIANAADREQQREAALRGGSRFNIRYKPAVPPDGLTPQGVMAALADWVDFSGLPGAPRWTAKAGARPASVVRASGPAPGELHKGMSRDEVEDVLGAPSHESKHMEGTLSAVKAVFEQGDHVIEATFLDGTLIKYTISSK